MRKDLFNNVKVVRALDNSAITSNTTTVGNIIDRMGFEAVLFLFLVGVLTDGDYALLLEHGDQSNLSDAAAVPDSQLLGTEAGGSLTDDGDDQHHGKLGYTGIKRYLRLSIVSTNTSSGAAGCTALALLANPHNAPLSTQETP